MHEVICGNLVAWFVLKIFRLETKLFFGSFLRILGQRLEGIRSRMSIMFLERKKSKRAR